MKKIILVVLSLFIIVSASAQKSSSIDKIADGKNAIGIKVGSGGAISYQRYLGSSDCNRIEANLGLGFGDYGFSGEALYQRVWALSKDVPGLNWYAGVGVGLGVYKDFFSFSILGQVGIEYTLKKAPVQFSLDIVPGLGISDGGAYLGLGNFGLGVRYRF